MMSLFSSFDLYFFPFSLFILMILSLNFFTKIYKNNPFSFVIQSIWGSLGSFFLSLKSRYFNKNVLNLFMTLSVMLLYINFCSVLSFNFALTSQISLVLLLGFSLWFSGMIFFCYNCYKGFFSHCVPEGTPMYLVWFLFLIEIISNSIRPITVTVRLVANILAGHLLMILLSSLVLSFPFATPLYIILNMVEFAVAMIQSYIFVTMLTLYYSDLK